MGAISAQNRPSRHTVGCLDLRAACRALNPKHGGTCPAGSHVLDEAERSLHDALCVLSQTVQDSRVLYGGGYPEMQMAKVKHLKPQNRESPKFLSLSRDLGLQA